MCSILFIFLFVETIQFGCLGKVLFQIYLIELLSTSIY